ncbi:MAG: zinc-binding dehydrogenase [Bacillota bacterium]|nr:zinc-binding dehydrogenase [Bacillota bacterium]MDI7248590.1 zinc-binding dehydrogenase [Bacillota bacterium]
MRAAVYVEPGVVEIQERPLPEPGPGEALVRVLWCGICGTDVHGCGRGIFPPGLVIGHEYVGEVVSAEGEAVDPGDLVVGDSVLGCGTCSFCRQGRPNLCKEGRVLGVNEDGAMAEYARVPLRSLYRVPVGLPPEVAAFTEPVSVAVHALAAGELVPGDPCLVMGAGPIGLLVQQLARLAGAAPVLVVEPRPDRAALARETGADLVLDPTRTNLSAAVMGVAGQGVPVVFECSGSPAALAGAPALCRPGGRVVVVGMCPEPVEIDFLALMNTEVEIRPVYCNAKDEFARALGLLAGGRLDLVPLLSDRLPLDRVPEVLAALGAGSGPPGKVLVRP